VPLVATIDADRIGQVMTNLLSNAAKFSPSGSVITVKLAMQDGQARISVIDQGPGMSAEFRKRIFRRFAQEAGSSHRGQAGTGLGLAISKNIVEHHGGTIMLDPDTAQGATFHIQLPIAGTAVEKGAR
jgi:signal transduction histidine kinase